MSHDVGMVYDGQRLWLSRKDLTVGPIDLIYQPDRPPPLPDHLSNDIRDALSTKQHLAEEPQIEALFKGGEYDGDIDPLVAILKRGLRECVGRSQLIAPRVVLGGPYVSMGSKFFWLEAMERAGARQRFLVDYSLASAIGLDLPVLQTDGLGIVVMHQDVTAFAMMAYAAELCAGIVPFGYQHLNEGRDERDRSVYAIVVANAVRDTMSQTLRDRHLDSLAANGFAFCCPGQDNGHAIAKRLEEELGIAMNTHSADAPPALEGIQIYLDHLADWKQTLRRV